MKLGLAKRVFILEEAKNGPDMQHLALFVKLPVKGIRNYVIKGPDLEECRKWGRSNIRTVKKMREARRQGKTVVKTKAIHSVEDKDHLSTEPVILIKSAVKLDLKACRELGQCNINELKEVRAERKKGGDIHRIIYTIC